MLDMPALQGTVVEIRIHDGCPTRRIRQVHIQGKKDCVVHRTIQWQR